MVAYIFERQDLLSTAHDDGANNYTGEDDNPIHWYSKSMLLTCLSASVIEKSLFVLLTKCILVQ